MRRVLLALVLFVCLVASVASFERRKTLDLKEPIRVPQGWATIRRAPKETKLRLVLALKQNNLDKLESLFWEVSDPNSAKYGKYLTMDEVTNLVAPSEETINKVNRWLDDNGVAERDTVANRDFVHIWVTVEEAERLLDTTYHLFFHEESRTTLIKSLGPYTVPESVADCLDFVTGAIGFPRIHQVAVRNVSSVARQSNPSIGPADLRQRYNVSADAIGKNPQNKQAVAEFQDQFYSQSDLDSFFQQYVTFGKYNSSVAQVIGYNDETDPGVEANLDIQYIMGVAPEVPTWFWSNPAYDFWGDLVAWTSQISNTTNPPFVHSISYGDQAEGPAGDYKDRLNTEFQKFGARGISIIFASGDSGTGCDLCFYYEPSFPATSPYVTSVGATRFLNGAVGPEGAVEAFGSGGGFSWHFSQPDYQKTAVDGYFKTEKDLPEEHYYNREGRGTPDVAALGIGFQVIVGGSVNSVGGTSASAPTFAAIVSLLNEIRLNANKPTLGFLNPFLYQTAAKYPNAFYDVTTGNNQYGCCLFTGFYAGPGWDPVTGLGTPNFAILKTLV